MAVHVPPSAFLGPDADTAELAPEEEDQWQLPTWDFPAQNRRRSLTVEVYSRYESVRLYLNGQLLGEQPNGEPQEFKTLFRVPYTAGELVAVEAYVECERFVLQTGGKAVGLRALADRAELQADGQDLAFIAIEAVDANGQWHPRTDQKVAVEVLGAGRLAGLGTGNVSEEHYYEPQCTLYQSLALAVVRTNRALGTITVRLSAAGASRVAAGGKSAMSCAIRTGG